VSSRLARSTGAASPPTRIVRRIVLKPHDAPSAGRYRAPIDDEVWPAMLTDLEFQSFNPFHKLLKIRCVRVATMTLGLMTDREQVLG